MLLTSALVGCLKVFSKVFIDQVLERVNLYIQPSKKCLVLDCDNTLWKGVLGEDGIDGIACDKDQYPGSVFHAAQNMFLELKNAGVILCFKF